MKLLCALGIHRWSRWRVKQVRTPYVAPPITGYTYGHKPPPSFVNVHRQSRICIRCGLTQARGVSKHGN